MGKRLQASYSNLFCIWGFNTTLLCFPTEALHRKTANKTPRRRPLHESSPTCSCHSRRTGRWAELLTHSLMSGKMTWRGGRGGRFEKERGNIHWSSTRIPLHCFRRLWKTKVQIAFRRQTSFIYILHYPYPNSSSEGLIIVLLSSYRLLSLCYPLVSPPSGFVESPTPETHTGFNTPVSPQSSALFARCVDVFIGLKQLLCSLPAVYSHTQVVIPLITIVCGHVMQPM